MKISNFIILIGILGFLFSFLLGSLIFWGLGNLIIYIFHISYIWTFLHGIVIEIIYIILKEIFKPTFKKGE